MTKILKKKGISIKKPLKITKTRLETKNVKSQLDTNRKKFKKRYSEMSVDDFLNDDFNDSNTESDDSKGVERNKSDNKYIKQLQMETENEEEIEDKGEVENQGTDDFNSGQSDEDDEVMCHKKSLAKLKDTDPEFYKFLQDNDKKLLNFNLSDSDSEEKDDEDENNIDNEVHKLSGELEVASDESDFEEDGKRSDGTVITLKMLKSWQNEIQVDKSNNTIVKVIRAFHATILRVSNNEENEIPYYKVEGSSVFNGVIQICVLELGPALRRYLNLPSNSKQPPHKCKKFVKIKATLREYFVDLLKLLGGVTSTNILNVLLKHLHYMSPMIVSYGTVLKQLLKRLIHLWGTADETVRVIAFLCILRLVNNQQQNNLDMVLKSMYMTYVQHSKFVSPNTLPMINFMRRSLVEMYAFDVNISYQHVFLYIRQLAIHLRNAITVKKKENLQAVYNWQFINSLKLWGSLLSVTNSKSQLQPLIYPFVQVCLGTINLIPTTQYYPLRFHVTEILIQFSTTTSVFIPILPFLVDILTSYDFNKKHQKVSMKPLQFLCVLRLSKSQLVENGFKDAVIDTIYGQILEYLALHSHSIAFPDLCLLCIIQIKSFLKKCSVASYCRKMRQILEKIEQNSKFIINERKTISFKLNDSKQIEAWETTLRNKGTPLLTYFESWKTMRNVKKGKEATNNDAVGDYNLPIMKKSKKVNEKIDASLGKLSGKVELFPSDSESEIESKTLNKPKRGKRGRKNAKPKSVVTTLDDNENGNNDDLKDIVEDLKASDW